MLRYALYARKSKDDKSGVIKSIRDQLDIWRDLAEVQDLQVVAQYEENKSAKDPGARPIYREMIGRIRGGEIDGILVWHVNRLARNMEEAGALAQMLIEGRIKEIRTPHWTYRPGDNILPLLLEQGMSAQYSLDLSEAVKRGLDSMVEGGGWPHQAKLGYKNARDPENPKKGIVVADPERWDLTRRGFELMLSGGYSVKAAIDAMNAWGLQTRPTPRRPGGPLSYALGFDIFTNPFYAGFTRHNGVLRRGRHPAMLTASEFDRLQGIVKRRGQAPARRTEFAFTGLIRCGRCGLGVTAERHVKKEKVYVYYRCSDPYNRCTKRGISEAALEREILAALEGVTVDPLLCELALHNVARWQEGHSAGAEEILKGQQDRLQVVERQRANLLNMMLNGLLTDGETYKAKDAELLRERNGLHLEVQKAMEDVEHIREQARAGFHFVRLARDNFLMAEGQRKKEIARALGVRYVLADKALTLEVDPLLHEMVKFVDEMMVKFEPAVSGSESRYRASFSQDFKFGRDAELSFEPPTTLIEALRHGSFPVLHLS